MVWLALGVLAAVVACGALTWSPPVGAHKTAREQRRRDLTIAPIGSRLGAHMISGGLGHSDMARLAGFHETATANLLPALGFPAVAYNAPAERSRPATGLAGSTGRHRLEGSPLGRCTTPDLVSGVARQLA